MEFEKDYVYGIFQKAMRKSVPKAFQKAFALPSRPEIDFFGLNSTKYIDELKAIYGDKAREKEERKKAKAGIKYTEWRSSSCVFLSIPMPAPINQLIYQSDLRTFSDQYGTQVHDLIGIIDLPIPDQVLYGRAAKKVQHRRGKKGFIPFNDPVTKLKEIMKDPIDLHGIGLNQKGLLPNVLEEIRTGQPAKEELRTMFQLAQSKEQTGVEFVDSLNSDPYLMKYMGKITHYGDLQVTILQGTKRIIYQGKSDSDVSTLCIPLGDKTLVSILNWNSHNNKESAYALKFLIDAFKQSV